MASIDLIRSCLDSIRQISEEIKDAVVYLDAGCLEAFQFIGAFPLLLELGVHSVCSLENMSALDTTVGWKSTCSGPARKMVVITSCLLSDAHRYILHCLGTHQTILRCIIFTSISEIAHSACVDSPLGPDAFHEYETLVLLDYEELIKKSEKKGSVLHPREKRKSTDIHNEKLTFNDDGSSRKDLSDDSIEDYDINMESGSSRKDLSDDSISCNEAGDGSTQLQISVHHFPMMMCPVSPRVFVFPSGGTVSEACLANDLEDSFSPGLPSISTGQPTDGEDVPSGATLTANFLYELAAKMDLKLEIFSLGDTSKIIGKMLTDMSSLYEVGRRNKKSAGLLLIDRTLDLLTPCCHGDSFLDRILSSVPRRERTKSSFLARSSQAVIKRSPVSPQRPPLDIRIPFETVLGKEEPAMNSTHLSESIVDFVSGWNSTEVSYDTDDLVDLADKVHNEKLDPEFSSLLSGSFLSSYTGANYLEALLDRGAKDGALMIKKWLIEALQNDKIPINAKGRLGLTSASELNTLVKKLAPDQVSLIRNRGIIQLALASEIVLSEPHTSRWDAFVSAERILNVSSVDTSQSLSSQIRDFIHTSILSKPNEQYKATGSSNSLLSFQDALLLAVIGYILAGENFPTSGSTGPFSWEEEHHLKEAVVDAVLERATAENLRFLHGLEKELEKKSKNYESPKPEPNVDDFDGQWGSWDDEDADQTNDQAYGDMQLKLELRDRVDNLFKIFHRLSGLKWRNPSLKEGWVASASNFGGDPYARKGLIYKLLTTILAKYDVPGLEYHSSAVGRFLKSGFGRFGLGQAKPNFGDQSVLLVFVVGGINTR
ncbi:sec1 family domain-containing protein MIP3 isoform X2 [Asparagus officinalis]|nr:sec1 family domain-containing protein MIP3 isoform X2 [Asparagus officinalis]